MNPVSEDPGTVHCIDTDSAATERVESGTQGNTKTGEAKDCAALNERPVMITRCFAG